MWWLANPPVPTLPRQTIPLTRYPGLEGHPALSADGERVAFTWQGPSGEGPAGLYVKPVAGGEPVMIHEGGGDVYSPAWSPDGRSIAFVQHLTEATGEPNDGLFVVPELGGASRHLGTFRMVGGHGLSWSDQHIAVSHRSSTNEPGAIHLVSIETGVARRLSSPSPEHVYGDSDPHFSPDGDRVAFVRRSAGARSDLYVMPVEGGEARRVTYDNGQVNGFDWAADGDSLVYATLRGGQVGLWSLWRALVDGDGAEPLLVVANGWWPSVSRAGGRLVYAESDVDFWITRASGPTAPEPGEAALFAASNAVQLFPRFSPDGRTVTFTSYRSGNAEIWVAAADGSNARPVTDLRSQLTYSGSWSPDGEQIAFASTKAGNWDVYAVDVASGIARRLTMGADDEAAPMSWSRDGSIYFNSPRGGRFELFKVPARGGEAIQVTTDGGFSGSESADGTFYYSKRSPAGLGPAGIWRMSADGRSEVLVVPHGGGFMWTLYEGGICYVNEEANPRTIECAGYEGGDPFWIATPSAPPIPRGLTVSPDGRWVLYVSSRVTGDLTLVENFR